MRDKISNFLHLLHRIAIKFTNLLCVLQSATAGLLNVEVLLVLLTCELGITLDAHLLVPLLTESIQICQTKQKLAA